VPLLLRLIRSQQKIPDRKVPDSGAPKGPSYLASLDESFCPPSDLLRRITRLEQTPAECCRS
jgi:hypothetical protein